jgi:hypothetical protein
MRWLLAISAKIDENEETELWNSEPCAVIYSIDVLIDILESAVKILPQLLIPEISRDAPWLRTSRYIVTLLLEYDVV